jgi:hypothetical protein
MENFMKLVIKMFALVAVLTAGACFSPAKVSAQEGSVSFQLFYDQLSPYGTWVDYQNYGYVWIPDVDREFSPYGTDGHWIFTDEGWTWVSDYSWGWAPFHYGRWAYDDSYGWLWVPHNEWGPAWVTWRRSEGYYGWAPMGPGISIDVSFGREYRVPNERWIFVSDRDISRPDIDRHYVDRSTNVTIINNSTVINNTYVDNSRHTTYVAGPARNDVQRITGSAVVAVSIRENDKPGQSLTNNQLQIYRPQVQAAMANAPKPVPPKLVALKEMKPAAERTKGNQRRNDNLPANGREQSAAPAVVTPPAAKAGGEQPPVVNPTDKNKGDAPPLGTENAKPSDKRGRGQPPPVDNPPEKNKNDGQPAQPPAAVPPANKPAGDQPRVTDPHARNRSNEDPSLPAPAKPSDNKGKGQQPRIANPPDKNKYMDQQPQPRNGRQPGNKKPAPQTTPPPNNKGKGRDAQPPKADKQGRDSTKSSQQQKQ